MTSDELKAIRERYAWLREESQFGVHFDSESAERLAADIAAVFAEVDRLTAEVANLKTENERLTKIVTSLETEAAKNSKAVEAWAYWRRRALASLGIAEKPQDR